MVNRDSHQNSARVKEILLGAANVSTAERSAYLDNACRDYPDLRRDVEALLDANEGDLDTAVTFESADQAVIETFVDSNEDDLETSVTLDPADSARSGHKLTDVENIAGYRILGQLGVGGMGVVYEAEQQSPRRRVALKVVRGGAFIDDLAIRMFQREADSLARLKHPGIASIYESGQTSDGQHFFAMELIQGKELHAALADDANPLTREELRGRLEVFVEICDAVNYAHQRGVIHRDLKPSNILVNEEGHAKILDFGIARIVDTDGGTMLTQKGSIQGTLAYMSPEQTRGLPDEIDLRTDVYSLGVILYELISGRRPYDVSGTVVHALRAINEDTPPSLREHATIQRFAGGDLETIVQTALAKSPDERYESAAALRDDIKRAGANQPILARPPSTIYQLRKLVTRNKVPFAFASLLAVTLVGFGIGMSILFSKAETSRRAAEVARSESEEVTTFMVDLFTAVDPGEKGRDVTVREVLDEGSRSMDDRFEAQPAVRGRLLHTMGNVYQALGLYEEALPLAERAVATREDTFGPDSPDVAESLRSQGFVLAEMGDYQAAMTLYGRALRILETAHGTDSAELIQTLRNMGSAQTKLSDFDAARLYLERAFTIAQATDSTEASGVASSLAVLEFRVGDYVRSVELFERALDLRRKLHGPRHTQVASEMANLSNALMRVGRTEDAAQALEEAISIQEEVLGPEHPRLARSLLNQGIALRGTDPVRGLSVIDRAIAIQEKALGSQHPDLATALSTRGELLSELGETDRSFADQARALEIRESVLGLEHQSVAQSLDKIAGLYRVAGDYAKARPLYERSLAIREAVFEPKSRHLAVSVFNLLECLMEQGDYAAALPLAERLVAADEAVSGPNDESTLSSMEMMAKTLQALGRNAEAEEVRARVEARRKEQGEV